jgi:hypothetical protein
MVITGLWDEPCSHNKTFTFLDTPQETLDIGSDYGGGEFLDQLA